MSSAVSRIGNTPIVAYEALSEKARPVCLYAEGTEEDLNVTVYWSKKKGIKGVAVYDLDGQLVGTVGKVPKAAPLA